MLALPATTNQYQRFMVRQAARLAAFAGLLAFVVCLACVGAQAGIEPPPVVESTADVTETRAEKDPESDHGSWLARDRKNDSTFGDARAVERRGSEARSWTFAALVAAFVAAPDRFAPASGLVARSLCPDSHARLARLLLASVPTRGPTLLG